MCLNNKSEYKVPFVDGWKVFSYKNNLLRSYFNYNSLEYQPNVVMDHLPNNRYDHSPGFYIFEKENHAYNIIFNKTFWKRWSAVNIVLPVTLYDVTHKCVMVQDDDPQCMAMNMPSFIGKKIIVHMNEENTKRFKRKIQEHYIEHLRYSADPQHYEIMKDLLT